MIFAAQYRFLDKITGKEVFYILPSLINNQLNVLDSRLVNFSISYYKDATVPIYIDFMMSMNVYLFRISEKLLMIKQRMLFVCS